MQAKRIITAILAALVLPLLMTSCVERFREVRITSARPVSIGLSGVSGFSLLLELGISNPAPAFEVTDIHITVYDEGTGLLHLDSDGLIIDAKCEKTYQVPFTGRFGENLSPLYLLQAIGNLPGPENLTASLQARVALRGGVGKVIELNDLPLKDIVSNYIPE